MNLENCLILFCGNHVNFFMDSFTNIGLKEPHLFEIELFCKIRNVFTDTFDTDTLNATLLNKIINFLKKNLTTAFEWKYMFNCYLTFLTVRWWIWDGRNNKLHRSICCVSV